MNGRTMWNQNLNLDMRVNKMTFKDKTNEDMVELYKKQADKMSFYHAAEGPSWYAEATERQACQSELKAIREEFVARSLDFPEGNWLC